MKFTVSHETKYRVRFSCKSSGFKNEEVDQIFAYFMPIKTIEEVIVYQHTGSLVLTSREISKSDMKKLVEALELKTIKAPRLLLHGTPATTEKNFYDTGKLVGILWKCTETLLLPKPLKLVSMVVRTGIKF